MALIQPLAQEIPYAAGATMLKRKEKIPSGVGEGWIGVSRCKLLDVDYINSKVLLYSAGNCIQCLEINHNGKECKEKKYIYLKLNLFTVQQKLTTL